MMLPFSRKSPARPLLAAAPLLMLSLSAPTHAALCHVTTAGNASGSGIDWSSPMDLQTALNSTSCSEIWVAKGTYRPTTGTDRDASFKIRAGTLLRGSFSGNETHYSQRDAADRSSILSGDIGVPGDVSDNSRRVVFIDGTNSAVPIQIDTVLEGFTIRDGYSETRSGGGLLCVAKGAGKQCSPYLRHVLFTGNYAYRGGAMAIDASEGGIANPLLRYVTFADNTADYGGAGLHNYAHDGGTANPSITQSDFRNNTSYIGGAVYNRSNAGAANPTLLNVTFSDNVTDAGGGAFYSAISAGGTGSPVFIDAAFSNNRTNASGGALYLYNDGSSSNPELSRVTFDNNSANNGGAIGTSVTNAGTGVLALGNATFSGNEGSLGGAIYGQATGGSNNSLEISSATFHGNHATSSGGAIYSGANTSTMIGNTILWGNTTSGSAPQVGLSSSGHVTISYGVTEGGCDAISGTACFGPNWAEDPKLLPMADNGGSTKTMLLGHGSGALDRGYDLRCSDGLVGGVDQRGVPRPQGARCDIGAVESTLLFHDGFEDE